ncbi:MAG: hypothetical protein IKF60_09950 [Solobacterium sp.]|nr:hypothetical protein [Solobacterium sp.]MBR3203897.1 hypothetical protein [Solobacterium sp.]
MGWLRTRFIAYGFLLGTAGVKILTSDDAKKVYTHCTAAVLRGVDDVTKTYNELKENCEDIAAEAKQINEKRLAEKEAKMIEDAKAVLAAANEK